MSIPANVLLNTKQACNNLCQDPDYWSEWSDMFVKWHMHSMIVCLTHSSNETSSNCALRPWSQEVLLALYECNVRCFLIVTSFLAVHRFNIFDVTAVARSMSKQNN